MSMIVVLGNNMNKKIYASVLSFFLFFATPSFAVDCIQFEIAGKDLKMSISKTSALMKYGKFENRYNCELKEKTYQCYGDDDSGDFSFNSRSNLLIINSLSFGDPDSKGAVLNGKTKEGKSCKK